MRSLRSLRRFPNIAGFAACLLVFFFSAALVPFDAAAQPVFEPGYMVPRANAIDGVARGDTLRGEIENRDWGRTPSSIRFRPSSSAPARTYGPSEIATFGVAGDQYESYDVKIDQRPTQKQTRFPAEIFASERVFLLKLVQGPLQLYSYVNERRHFFLQREDQTPRELIYYVQLIRRDGKTYVAESSHYQAQLEQAASPDCDNRSFKRIGYAVRDLSEFVHACNGDAGQDLSANAQRRSGFRLQHRFGVLLSRSQITGDLIEPSLRNTGFGFGVSYDAVLTRDVSIPRYAFLVGVSLNRIDFGEASNSAVITERVLAVRAERIVNGLAVAQVSQSRAAEVVLLGTSIGAQRRFLDGPTRPFFEFGVTLDYPLSYTATGRYENRTSVEYENDPARSGETFFSTEYGGTPWTMIQVGLRLGTGVQRGRWSGHLEFQYAFRQRGGSDIPVSLDNLDALSGASGYTPRKLGLVLRTSYQF